MSLRKLVKREKKNWSKFKWDGKSGSPFWHWP